jgi:hypothetical protein
MNCHLRIKKFFTVSWKGGFKTCLQKEFENIFLFLLFLYFKTLTKVLWRKNLVFLNPWFHPKKRNLNLEKNSIITSFFKFCWKVIRKKKFHLRYLLRYFKHIIMISEDLSSCWWIQWLTFILRDVLQVYGTAVSSIIFSLALQPLDRNRIRPNRTFICTIVCPSIENIQCKWI